MNFVYSRWIYGYTPADTAAIMVRYRELAIGMRFLIVKVINGYSWNDMMFQSCYNANLFTIYYPKLKQMEVAVVVVVVD